jgi:hypothetical protein
LLNLTQELLYDVVPEYYSHVSEEFFSIRAMEQFLRAKQEIYESYLNAQFFCQGSA